MATYNNIGIYIHIPFCIKKCPYCDFYSIKYENKGTLQINARCFTIAQKEGGYSGPSKNGFIIPIIYLYISCKQEKKIETIELTED